MFSFNKKRSVLVLISQDFSWTHVYKVVGGAQVNIDLILKLFASNHYKNYIINVHEVLAVNIIIIIPRHPLVNMCATQTMDRTWYIHVLFNFHRTNYILQFLRILISKLTLASVQRFKNEPEQIWLLRVKILIVFKIWYLFRALHRR